MPRLRSEFDSAARAASRSEEEDEAMARSKNKGKARRKVELRPQFSNGVDAVFSRMQFGSTHRILRRNRPLWSRLLGKQRRAHDREVIASSHE
jgi:hypothetical protein